MGDVEKKESANPERLNRELSEISEVEEINESECESERESELNQEDIDLEDRERLLTDSRLINTVANPLHEMTIFLLLGLKSYGGVDKHISLFNSELIEKREWMGRQKFSDLCALAQAIPGPTSAQLAAALGTFKAGFWGGFLALLYFSIPGFSLTLLLGLIFNIACKGDPNALLPDWLTPTGPFVSSNKLASFLSEVSVGFPPTALSLIFLSFLSFSSKISIFGINGKICFLSCLVSILVKPTSAPLTFSILFLVGSLISIINHWINDNESVQNPTSRNQSQSQTLTMSQCNSQTNLSSHGNFPKNEKISGLLILIWIFSLLLSFTLGRFILREHLLILFYKFYIIGSFSFGNEFVILTFIYKEFVNLKFASSQILLIGTTIVSILPGNIYNISIFIGVISLSFKGGILSLISLYLPGLFFFFSILPFWERLKNNKLLLSAFCGLKCVSLGLILSVFGLLSFQSVSTPGTLFIGLTNFFFIYNLKFSTPLASVLSCLLGWIIFKHDIGGPYCWISSYVAKSFQTKDLCLHWHNYQSELVNYLL